MAKGSKGGTIGVRRVRTKDERNRPSVFMRLKAEESFKGIALFEPNPELEDNPGYYEYYDHYDKQGNTYVPCAGENCPFCAVNDNPSTRAMTVFYFPEATGKDRVKIFTMNYRTTTSLADDAEEEDGILGKMIRVKRMDDKGDYKVRVLNDKPLTAKQLKSAMTVLEDVVGENGLEGLINTQLKRQLERLNAIAALDDDDDDEEEEATPARSTRGKATATVDVDEDEDEDEEADEDEDEEEEASADEDEDEDEEESDEDEEEEESDEEEDEEEGETEMSVEIVKVNESEETFDVKIDGKGSKVKMWVGNDLEPDYDDFKKGDTATVTAAKDDDDDWVLTSIEVAKARGGKGKGKTKAKK